MAINPFPRIQPLDKAGAYAVQDESAMIIERVDGSWSNVKGLPMERLREELAQFAGA
jgi:septum formation protein